VKQNSSEYIRRTSREYGMYVLDYRAIPAMTDGLKSSQRIALWLLKNRTDKIKTIALAGQMIASELYLHGDASAAATISMLAGPYCNNRPLVHGIGAFGTRADPTSFSAPRYTSVKRSKIATDCLYVDLDIVPMVENHDGSNWMPSTFLPLVPLVLLNGIKGIATGWSTNILPRRFEDLVGAVDDCLRTGKVQRPLLPHYESRDVTVVRENDDPNKYVISGKVHKKNTTTVIVTELPPDLSLEKFREKLVALEEDGKIVNFVDRSTKRINIEIKMTRSVLGKLTDASLIDFLKIRTLTTENITVQGIYGSKVITYGTAEELIEDWVIWRRQLYLARFQKLLADEEITNLYWRYIISCFEYELPGTIPSLAGKFELKNQIATIGEHEGLSEASDDMLERIASVASYKWTQAGLDDATKQLAASDKRVVEYTEFIRGDRKRTNLFKKEVGALL
jgi:DNA gyrase/topoisomerase IV subunit A